MIDKLQRAYAFFNTELFRARLPDVPINIKRVPGALGSFTACDGAYGITISPDCLQRPQQDIFATLVHEMAHLWDELYGKPAPGNGHGQTWMQLMQQLGLPPVPLRGGVSHRVAPGGAFTRAYTKLQSNGSQIEEPPPIAYPGHGPQGSRPTRRPLQPPLPPRSPRPTLAGQLSDGFNALGQLGAAGFHGALAFLMGWLCWDIMNPILSRSSSHWRVGAAWLHHLITLLFC